ncbi:hypothetical protein [Agrobacterium cavarae]|uniref:hypothetical protein n=1 Tax=Agrobacterium cavarae TaxID=2528239 RepID=UPI002897581C|nr:hypothetical protein [Agrobacterium cavarae]
MDAQRNSTAACAGKDELQVLRAQLTAHRDLEDAICSLQSMSYLLDEVLDSKLVDHQTRKQVGPLLTIMLTGHELEMLIFAYKNVAFRASSLQDAFYAAAEVGR